MNRRMSKAFDHIKDLLLTPQVLCMPTAENKYTLKCEKNQTSAEVSLFTSSKVNGN